MAFLAASRSVGPGSRERAAGRAPHAQRARAGAPRPHRHASGEDVEIGSRAPRPPSAQLERRSHLRDLSRPHPQALGLLGVARLPAAAAARPRSGRRHLAPRNAVPRARAEAVERGLRAAVAAARRRTLRTEPEPAVQAPSVPGDPQAVAGRGAADLSREPRGVRHQPAAARHPVRGRQLGVADARRVGHRLAGDARRARDHAVHLLPAGRRHRPRSRSPARSPTGSSASRCSCSASTTSSTSNGAAA